MDIPRETRLSNPIVTDTDLVIIPPKIVVGGFYMERMGIGDHLYGAKAESFVLWTDGMIASVCLLDWQR